MKITYKLAAALAGVSVLLSSCIVADGGYGSYGVSAYGNGYSTSVAWSNASYDASGFPIFGYYYGQPVYGYTAAGAAVFSLAALTALCFVPHWGPAPWYHGSWHYPPQIHRVSAPPRYPSGHMPHMRPQGGLNAPIHRNPSAAMHHGNRPQGPAWAGKHANMPNRPSTAPHANMPNRPSAAPHANMPNRPSAAPHANMPNRPSAAPHANMPNRPSAAPHANMPNRQMAAASTPRSGNANSSGRHSGKARPLGEHRR